MRKELEDKVTQSVLLIRRAYRHCRHRDVKLELAYSGGKDSDVLVELCKIAGVWGGEWLRPLHRCTTIDPPYTLRHCMDVGVEVLRPRRSFRECIVRSGFPTRFVRHCCGYLKEFAVEDYVLVGVRRSESSKRAARYKEPEACRTYNGRGKAIQYYPLLYWTNEDIEEFVGERQIRCHPLYYREDGSFDVTRRLGCVGCPMASRKNRIADFKAHPKFVRFWCKAGAEFLATHPDSSANARFANVYEWFVANVFCDSIKEFDEKFRGVGLFAEKTDCKVYLEDYFGADLNF